MQCGAGARPEYAGKRLVAVKRMKKRWEGGWDECRRLKELESLRAISYHPNIIPLYDFFLLPASKELYFVFESMEGNLYQLIKTRKGKPLAGYFHRDMKPENLLVTTTGLHDYRTLIPGAPPDAPLERDVVVIIKLADFGLARETNSKPPYTEYVSTRWYRAPEVLLKSRDYSNPVDMWALGTIMAEVVNLRPLFPGQGEIDQVARICELLGDPIDDYGLDERGKPRGGGKWPRGVRMARTVGFAFQKNIYALFDPNVPIRLVECIADLLKYEPELRLTSRQCLEHPYLLETIPFNNSPGPPSQPPSQLPSPCRTSARNGIVDGISPNPSLRSVVPRSIPPSHSHPGGHPKLHPVPSPHLPQHIPDASSTHRSSFYDSGFASITRRRSISETSQQTSEFSNDAFVPHSSEVEARRHPSTQDHVYSHGPNRRAHANGWSEGDGQSDWDAMDVSPQVDVSTEPPYVTTHHPMDIQTSPIVPEYPARPAHEPEPPVAQAATQAQGNKRPILGSLNFGKKHARWGLDHPRVPPPALISDDPKQRKKELERMAKEVQKEADRQRRLRAEKTQREQARAVMKNNRRLAHAAVVNDFQWRSGPHGSGLPSDSQAAAPGPIRQAQSYGPSSLTVNAAGGSYKSPSQSPVVPSAESSSMARSDWRRDNERVAKARRRDYDDDHSMSSDVHGSIFGGLLIHIGRRFSTTTPDAYAVVVLPNTLATFTVRYVKHKYSRQQRCSFATATSSIKSNDDFASPSASTSWAITFRSAKSVWFRWGIWTAESWIGAKVGHKSHVQSSILFKSFGSTVTELDVSSSIFPVGSRRGRRRISTTVTHVIHDT
ncbi:hypothetical protein EW026_g974 [Hermanssonia centrifuga]|uniref:Protein kinase domain-containing protein n=1 Tax=Hermanssonia centrifuga TaxID=98765 RepID=A0A4S4KTM5_9APHY|nr:hypothetical protein EW026_g974 [Hermanssonia centrifuga]